MFRYGIALFVWIAVIAPFPDPARGASDSCALCNTLTTALERLECRSRCKPVVAGPPTGPKFGAPPAMTAPDLFGAQPGAKGMSAPGFTGGNRLEAP